MVVQWRALLSRWNEELLRDDDALYEVSPSAVRKRWLGFPPATEGAIRAKERRLGVRLPASFRSFLTVSNGWRTMGNPSIAGGALWPVRRLKWFREENQTWIDCYTREMSDDDPPEFGAPVASTPMSVHRRYGAAQDCCRFRAELLNDCLQIGALTDSGVYLLCPTVRARGEWEAWFFANWLPGANRYRSFKSLISSLCSKTGDRTALAS